MRNFLYKMQCAMARFMYGRNGPDQLSRVGVWAVLILYLPSFLLQGRFPLAAGILSWITLLLWAWLVFRMFSKNLSKRRAENQKFINWRWRMKNRASGARARRADKDHKYFTCKCGAICRVPVGKGKVLITCPKCGANIEAKT